MSIYEFALKMEEDGREFYLEHSKDAAAPELKKVLLELADDELKHYNIFRAMNEGQSAEYKETDKTTILDTVRNVFEEMKSRDKNYAFPAEATRIWREALEVEKKSERLYREKADQVQKADQKKILNKIADEEHKHWVTINNVIQFLDRPKQWLEDAEWSHLEDY
jgi:rubrerythrin